MTFLTSDNIANITWTVAPWAIIAIGEVFLLVCGEMDLSVGFILGFSPYLMHYLIDFYGVPPMLAVMLSLLMGVAVGFSTGSSPSPSACRRSSPPSAPGSSSWASCW